MIIVYFVWMLISISSFQISGVFITTYGSSGQRATIDIARKNERNKNKLL